MTGAPDFAITQYGVTQLHPLAFLATMAAGAAMVGVRRSQAILPLTLVACLIPGAQRLVVGTLDFNMIRILILFGWLRVFARGELRPLRLNEIDVAFIAWITAEAAYAIRGGPWVRGQRLRLFAHSVYFLFTLLHPQTRCARRATWPGARRGGARRVRWATGRNIFAVFGGVPAHHDSRWQLRCQRSRTRSWLGASGDPRADLRRHVAPFPPWRQVALLGAVSGIVIAVSSASSGPALSVLVGFLAFALWPLRRNLRALRWGLLLGATVIHFAREKPVWHLIARMSNLMGGEGYHRYSLIDAFIHRWREWWLVGTGSTAHWGPILWDTTNQYVAEGVSGGIVTLVAFVTLLSLSFQASDSPPGPDDLWAGSPCLTPFGVGASARR
jgi:hypothetical protein